MAIEIPALPRPTLYEVQVNFPYRGITSIYYDVSPTEAFKLQFTCPRGFSGLSTMFPDSRIQPYLNAGRCLGLQHAIWLMKHHQEFTELQSIFVTRKIGSIRFPGIVVYGYGRYYSLSVSTGFDPTYGMYFTNYKGLESSEVLALSSEYPFNLSLTFPFKEFQPMTNEEMARELEKQGFEIKRPRVCKMTVIVDD